MNPIVVAERGMQRELAFARELHVEAVALR